MGKLTIVDHDDYRSLIREFTDAVAIMAAALVLHDNGVLDASICLVVRDKVLRSIAHHIPKENEEI